MRSDWLKKLQKDSEAYTLYTVGIVLQFFSQDGLSWAFKIPENSNMVSISIA